MTASGVLFLAVVGKHGNAGISLSRRKNSFKVNWWSFEIIGCG